MLKGWVRFRALLFLLPLFMLVCGMGLGPGGNFCFWQNDQATPISPFDGGKPDFLICTAF